MINLLRNLLGIFLCFWIIDIYVSFIIKNRKEKNINNLNLKINNSNFIKKISFYIDYLITIDIKFLYFFKPITLIFISTIIFILVFIISYKFLSVFSSSLIIAVYSFFIPYLILQYLYNKSRRKILDVFPTYIISLKNYTNISNDIIIAMKKVESELPLRIFINKFNLLIDKGISVYDSFERLKKDINIKKISEFIMALQNCYINGGNFSKLLDRYSKIINNISLQREKEIQDNFSSILVLIVLIIINIFLIIAFVYSNETYKSIVTNSFIGKTILNINILSYLLVFYFIKKLNKLEE